MYLYTENCMQIVNISYLCRMAESAVDDVWEYHRDWLVYRYCSIWKVGND